MLRLDIASIDRVEAERDYVRLFASGSSYLLRGSIASIEARLDPAQFLRVHRSVILRRSSIAELRHRAAGAWDAVDRDGGVSSIGRSHLARVRASLGLAKP
jgi:two-component system response regulator AlgR